MFPGPLSKSIYGKALNNGLWKLQIINIRDYADDKHKTVDDTVIGGGSGMLLKPDVLAKSIDSNISSNEKIFYLSPRGKNLIKIMLKSFLKRKQLILYVVTSKE